MRRFDLVAGLVGLIVAVGGLALLFDGLADASPVAFFGTPEEREARFEGRTRVLIASLILLAAAIAFALRRRGWSATAVALPGLACSLLAFGLPETLFSWLAFVALAPAALGAALIGARPTRRL